MVFSVFFGYNEIRSMSGRYASYWNAFLSYTLFMLSFQRISPTSPNMQRQAAAAAANQGVLNAQLAAAAAARLPGTCLITTFIICSSQPD